MVPIPTAESPFRRRSQRIPLTAPLFVTSLDPKVEFGERCDTMVVSKHGCEIRATKSLPPDTRLRLDIMHSKQTTTAQVVRSEPGGPGGKGWHIVLTLENAENFWGIRFPPEDWLEGTKKEAEEKPTAETQATEEPPSRPPVAPPSAPVAATPAKPALPAPPRTAPVGPAPAAAKSPAAPAVTPAAVPASAPPPTQERAPAAASPAAEQVSAPPRAAPTRPPSLDQAAKLLEALLQERAKAISAEFEDSYRKSLGDLMVRLRADLEEKATADWDRWRDQARMSLLGVAMEVRQQVTQETEQRRQQTAELDTKLQALQTLQTQIEARLGAAEQALGERLARESERWAAQTREATQALFQQVRQQAGQSVEWQAQLEEVRSARDYVESLVRLLPETVDRRVGEGMAGILERVRARIEEEFTAQRDSQAEALEQRLLTLAQQAGDDLRQKLLEDLDRSEREFLDRVQVRLEEARAVEGGLREHSQRLSDNLTAKADELRATLNAGLDQQAQQLNLRAETAMRNLGEQAWNGLYQRLRAAFDDRQQAVQQRLESAETALAGLQEHTAGLQALVESQMAAYRQESEKVHAWLAQETQRFQQVVHETLLEATGQIKGRVHQALEMSQEPLERRGEEIRTQLDQLASARSAELSLRAEEAEERLRNLDKQVGVSLDALLQARMADALARFEEQSGELARKSTAELQAALSEALESMAQVFRDKFGKDS